MKNIEIIKKWCKKVCNLTRKESFIFTFPLIALATITLLNLSVLGVIFLIIWVITVFININNEEE